MSESIKSQILAELNTVARMIDNLPQSSVIDRMSLEARKLKLEAEIAELTANHTNKENNMSEWITDRKPTLDDCLEKYAVVYGAHGGLVWYATIEDGVPWKPVPECEPYVKPKRFEVLNDMGGWYVSEISTGEVATPLLSTREDAEKIASIFEMAVL